MQGLFEYRRIVIYLFFDITLQDTKLAIYG